MKNTILIAATSTLLLVAAGCGSNRIVGSNLTEEGHWYGVVGITGSQNDITIREPSELTKLSIIGDMNKVYVDDHVPLAKVEIWGRNNAISIPDRLIIRSNQIGKETIITRRPSGGRWMRRSYVYQPAEAEPEKLDSAPLRLRNETPDESDTDSRDASHYYAPGITVEEE